MTKQSYSSSSSSSITNDYATTNSYPAGVMRSIWRRLKGGTRPPGALATLPASQSIKLPCHADPHGPPRITQRSKSVKVLGEILRAHDLGYASLPPSLLNKAKEALRP